MTNVTDPTAALRALDVPEDVAAVHLARLLATDPTRVVPLHAGRRNALRAAAGGTVIGVTLLSGAGVAAASTARPGDALYGLKSAREHLQLAMARHGESRARLEVKLARTRLGEAAELFRAGQTERAVETLARADAALASARAQGGNAVYTDVDGEFSHRIEVLNRLLAGGLPTHAADAAREAIERAVRRETGRPESHPGNAPDKAKPDHPAKPGKSHGRSGH